jgi:hypothetical protein
MSAVRAGTHGQSRTRLYKLWQKMKQRCENPSSISYRFYGAKGIAVCERWKEFENFRADVGEGPGKGFTLDRLDPLKGYEPGNVQWITRAENASRMQHTALKGEANGRAKLSEGEVIAIRESPLGCHRLAKLYGVSKKLILNIRHRKAWAHVP